MSATCFASTRPAAAAATAGSGRTCLEARSATPRRAGHFLVLHPPPVVARSTCSAGKGRTVVSKCCIFTFQQCLISSSIQSSEARSFYVQFISPRRPLYPLIFSLCLSLACLLHLFSISSSEKHSRDESVAAPSEELDPLEELGRLDFRCVIPCTKVHHRCRCTCLLI